jgi:hypothetical protein
MLGPSHFGLLAHGLDYVGYDRHDPNGSPYVRSMGPLATTAYVLVQCMALLLDVDATDPMAPPLSASDYLSFASDWPSIILVSQISLRVDD